MTIGSFDLDKQLFIIAELSANHNHDLALCKDAVRLAKEADADAIKLQTYTPDTITLDVKNEYFKAGDIWSNEYLYDLYARAYMPWEWQRELKAYADELDIMLFSSPFDATSVDFLETLHVKAYKIASFEITDIPLIQKVAALGKPVIISTGIADIEDIELALLTCKEAGNEQIVLLKCTSAYPAKDDNMNLATITDMAARFGVSVGLSDHSLGIEAPVTAVALGARVIEKHFTPDKNLDTPDREFSLDPTEFKTMVDALRRADTMRGGVHYGGSKRYARSLFVTADIAQGEAFTCKNIRSVRPGHGLHPKYYEKLLICKAPKAYKAGEPLELDAEFLNAL